MSFDIDGLVDLHDDLEQVRRRVQNPGGENGIPLEEPFTDDFMRRNTDFDSLDAFFGRSPWQVEDEADRDAIPKDGLNAYVAEHTQFSNWEEMAHAAAEEWVLEALVRASNESTRKRQ